MRFEITIDHPGLGKIRRIAGHDKWLVEEKARLQKNAWDSEWAKRTEKESRAFLKEQKIALASERTMEAQKDQQTLRGILGARTIKKDLWQALRNDKVFPEPAPTPPANPEIPREPSPGDARYQVSLGFLDSIFSSRRIRKEQAVAEMLRADREDWSRKKAAVEREFEKGALAAYTAQTKEWQRKKGAYLRAQAEGNQTIEELKISYESKNPEAIARYCESVLSLSEYPNTFPSETAVSFLPESGVLVVDYRLPAIDDLPTLKQVKFVTSKGKFEESHFKQSEINGLFDDVSYQICLRSICELFGYDKVGALHAVVFNGWVDFIDPSNGKGTRSCIMSVYAERSIFGDFNLDQVDPRACFRALKGVGSSKLSGLAAVAPLIRLNRDDPRFIQSIEIEKGIDEGTNLAAIGWEDFEQLIREIFEREFSRNGGEVKVTRASRDGGVDAVAFDPDPIRGGKIVIQAKRYTNTVDVSAVRDLYGTVMNEGATKGILVTTSSYGPDAYAFAKDKPLSLMDGGNLLYLLQQHGHKAYINLQEAKQLNTQPLARTTKM